MNTPKAVNKENNKVGNTKNSILDMPSTLISLIENKIKIMSKAKERTPNKIKELPKEKAIKANTSYAKNIATKLYFDSLFRSDLIFIEFII